MADPSFAPLTVTIGESVFALAARSPGLVDLAGANDSTPLIVARPVTPTVVTDERALTLPPTRYVQIQQVAGVVTGVDFAPMVSFGRLKPCNTLAAWLIAEAERNGWKVTRRNPVDADELMAAVEKGDQSPYEWTYAELARGDATLRIALSESAQRPGEMVPPSAEPLFLVNMSFRNKPLKDERYALLFARRKELTGGTGSVPLTAWRPH